MSEKFTYCKSFTICFRTAIVLSFDVEVERTFRTILFATVGVGTLKLELGTYIEALVNFNCASSEMAFAARLVGLHLVITIRWLFHLNVHR